MSATFHGSTDYIPQPDTREWDKANGWQTVRAWIGPRVGSLPFAQSLAQDGAMQVVIRDAGPISTITATYPDIRDQPSVNSQHGREINVTWELDVSEIRQDVTTHKSISQSTDEERFYLNEAKAAVSAGDPINDNWTDAAKNLYRLLSQGTSDCISFCPILRKTIRVSDADGVRASLEGVGKAGPAPEDCPQLLWKNPIATADGKPMEWLKKGPRVLGFGRGKYSIVQEWRGAAWSRILYGGTHEP